MQSFNEKRIERSLYQLSAMAALVETAVAEATAAFSFFDTARAFSVIEKDKAINSFEIDIDNSTYTLFNRSAQKIAPELLRKLLAIQKINPMLERIGDHAVAIAEAVILLVENRYSGEGFILPEMAKATATVLHEAVNGFLANDHQMTERVLNRYAALGEMHTSLITSLKTGMLSSPVTIPFATGFALFGIGKNLERIAEVSTNIAEETLLTADSSVMKHQSGAVIAQGCSPT